MSYSLSVRGATAALALAVLATKFDTEVVAHQPLHAKDREPALAAAASFVALLPVDEAKDVVISLSGYATADLSNPDQAQLTAASVAVNAELVERNPDV